ncbi:hypothetical protein [Nocardia sp. CA-120079]|uniref:hypothetical protein n=1 Tax=Nocardia sp. CA-120079 TaxID=3239974 RepID=UPI003D975993
MEIPPMQANFAQLIPIMQNSPSTLQAAFFGWMAWLFALIATVLVIVAARSATPVVGGVCVLVGIAESVITILALKGTEPWSAVFDSLQFIRVGAVMFVIGMIALIVAGVRCLVGAQAGRYASLETTPASPSAA